jgi:hypothetical protein
MSTTETRIYTGETVTHAFDGFKDLLLYERYTGVPQEDGTFLVALVGAPVGTGVQVTAEQWDKWFQLGPLKPPFPDDDRFLL